jgi:hypothetical protein
MHSYSISTKKRITVISIIALTSALLGQLVNPILASYGLASYGSLVIFGMLFAGFNFYVWDWPYVRELVGIPNLTG